MTKNKINILLGIILFCSILFVGYQVKYGQVNQRNVLKIGFITDAHFNAKKNKKTGEWKLDWRSREAMERFVEKMNKEFHPDFVVENGDFVDGKDKRSYQTWKMANEIFKKVEAPQFHILGNHETNSFKKDVWLELTGYDKTYYYKDIEKGKSKYRILFLDGNYLPDDTDADPEKHFYPGHINKKEWNWMEDKLKEAYEQNKMIIIFVHQPPVSTAFFKDFGVFPQGEELHNLFNKYGVRAVFSGHIENLCNSKDGQTRYFVLQGFWKGKKYLKEKYRFKDAGAFYYLTFTPNDVKVKMERRVFDDTVKKGSHLDKLKGWFKLDVTEEYNCQSGEQLNQEYFNKLKEEKSEKEMPVQFVKSNLKELSGITFLGDSMYLVSDNQTIVKTKEGKIIQKIEGAVPDAEGITTDGEFLYVVSELENSIYKFDKQLKFKEKKQFDIKYDGDVNIGLEGIAHYKDDLFFLVHQGKNVKNNIFLVDFKTGNIIRSEKIDYNDLSGVTYADNKLYIVSGGNQKIIVLNVDNFEVVTEYDIDDKSVEGIAIKDKIIYLIKDNEDSLRKQGKL